MTETIKGSVVLITGATGAIAQALIAGLAARGAAKIYAAARDISFLAASSQLVPIKMDVTSDDDVSKAAAVATDVVSLELKDEVSQAVMKPVGAEGYDYTYVIMPMRV